jgi:pimeloyl-ACP methyl ester carboxylesterase
MDAELVGRMLADLVEIQPMRWLAAPLAYRLKRCSPADVRALKNAAAGYRAFAQSQGNDPFFSRMLQNNIVFSELFPSPLPEDASVRALTEGLVVRAVSFADLLPIYRQWPRYRRDELVGAVPRTTVPLLMMNGSWDPQTPLWGAERVGRALSGPAQTFLAFPGVSHVVLSSSPSKDAPRGATCGAKLILQFLADPNATLDTSCIASLDVLDFGGVADMAGQIFGTPDAYEGDPAAPRKWVPSIDWQRVARRASAARIYSVSPP